MSIDRALTVAAYLWASVSSCHLPEEGPDERVVVADERLRQGIAEIEAERCAEGEALLREAYRGHVAAGSHAGASADASWMMRRYSYATMYRAAVEWGDRAYAEAVASEDEALIGRALVALLQTVQFIDDAAASAELLAAAERYVADDDQVTQIKLLFARALERRSNGRLSDAELLQGRALAMAREIGDLWLSQASTINLADIAIARGDLVLAERYLQDARALCERRGVPPSQGLLMNEAALARAQRRWGDAQRLLDRMAVMANPDELWRIHRDRGLTAQAQGKLDEAASRYRAAVEAVEGLRRQAAPTADTAEFLEKRWSPFQHLFALQIDRRDARGALETLLHAQGRMFLDAMARTASVGTRAASIDDALGEAIGRIDRSRDLVPALAGSPLADVQPLDDVLAGLRDRHVLTYFQGGDRLRLIVIEAGEPRISSVDVGTQELGDLVDDFRLHPEDPLAGANLGAAILPADALPAEGGRIYVVPTGALLRVPVAPLVVSGQRVIDHHEVSYAPGVTSVAFDRPPTRASGGLPAVVIADSRLVVNSNDVEVSAVMAATGAVARLGRQATTKSFRDAGNANLLHLIAHSGVNARGGYLSLDDDQEVTATDILGWGMRPRLVVLLTCASAATPRNEMWGSLAAAFLAAGSEHVVATLSAVPTEDASTFALAFYRNGGVEDPVRAVARAQRELAATMPVGKWSQYVVTGP